jgi:oligoribonuclease NrnB/cAMP/cGMP phosphodiesterase (DHH superfamily)
MKLNPRAKILSISHNDLDGVGAQILLGACFKNITYVNCSYFDIDKELLSASITNDYDYVFVTDIFPNNVESLSGFNNLILIDHHQTAIDCPEKRWFVNKKYSATYLVKHFLDKMFGADKLKKYTKMVKLINDYDLWQRKYKHSAVLNYLFTLYYADKFRERFRSGDLSLTLHEKEFISDINNKFDDLYENLEVFECETINACFFISDTMVNELSDKLLHTDGYDIVFFNTLKNYKVSIRSKLDDFNVGIYLKEKNIGGGHFKAAGVDVATEEDMNKTLDFLEKDFYDILPHIRR